MKNLLLILYILIIACRQLNSQVWVVAGSPHKKALPSGDFTFLALSFADHTDEWALRDIPERKVLREWFNNALIEKSQQSPAGDNLTVAPEE